DAPAPGGVPEALGRGDVRGRGHRALPDPHAAARAPLRGRLDGGSSARHPRHRQLRLLQFPRARLVRPAARRRRVARAPARAPRGVERAAAAPARPARDRGLDRALPPQPLSYGARVPFVRDVHRADHRILSDPGAAAYLDSLRAITGIYFAYPRRVVASPASGSLFTGADPAERAARAGRLDRILSTAAAPRRAGTAVLGDPIGRG